MTTVISKGVMLMILNTTKKFCMYIKSEAQHNAMNALMNMRYTIQKKLEPVFGRYKARKCALHIVMLVEIPLKIILYQSVRFNT